MLEILDKKFGNGIFFQIRCTTQTLSRSIKLEVELENFGREKKDLKKL